MIRKASICSISFALARGIDRGTAGARGEIAASLFLVGASNVACPPLFMPMHE